MSGVVGLFEPARPLNDVKWFGRAGAFHLLLQFSAGVWDFRTLPPV